MYKQNRWLFLPNSCGNSWQNMAMLVETPRFIFSVKAAPIANPSAKLCTASPITTITATAGISVNNKYTYKISLTCLNNPVVNSR